MKISFNSNLRKNPYKGLYIALEGIDGSGKSTQIRELVRYFRGQRKKVALTSEPTQHLVTGQLMRAILNKKVKVPSSAFQFIYSADRSFNHATIVEPALKKGNIVLTHRAFWSALAHGVVDRDGEKLKKEEFTPIILANGIISYYHQFIVPDLTIYLDISVSTALARLAKMGKKGDIYENKEKLTKVLRAYKWVVANFGKNFKMVEGEKPTKVITKEITDEISRFI